MNDFQFQSNKRYIEGQTDYDDLITKAIGVTLKTKQPVSNDLNSAQKKEYKDEKLNEIKNKLESVGYIPTAQILYSIKNSMLLNMPILVEGEPGVGKTSLACAMAKAYDMELIKVQFYEGITNSDILYEYDYPKQMLYMNAIRDNINQDLKGLSANEALEKLSNNGINFFGKEFLIERPLLKAISGNKKKILLLDEIDKAQEDTEYLLLEILDTYSISIPEYGTIKCNPDCMPIIFLTSNRYRELSDALKRRCIYLYIEPKTIEETSEIIAKKAHVSDEFAQKVASKINEIRKLDLKQKPSISDSINWAISLMSTIGAFDNVESTLGTIIKNKTDMDIIKKARIL